jgi:hypothetical protein
MRAIPPITAIAVQKLFGLAPGLKVLSIGGAP